MATLDEKVEKLRAAAMSKLSIDEQIAYDKALRSGRAPLAPTFNQKLYDLYLRGFSSADIVTANPGLDLGAVVRARVDGDWDARRDRYTGELLTDSAASLRQTAAESLNFLSLILAVAHKEHGEKLRKYLVSGDPADLGDFKIESFKGYKLIIDTIAQLIGANQKSTVTHKMAPGGPVEAGHGSSPEEGGGILGMAQGALTPKQADAMRLILEQGKG